MAAKSRRTLGLDKKTTTGGINYNTDPRFVSPAQTTTAVKTGGIDYNKDPRFIGTSQKLPNQMDQVDPGRPGGNGPASFTDTRDKGGSTVPGGYAASYAYFTPSDSYLKAMESANQLLTQLSSGRTSYTDKINGLMDQIANRPKFQYDMDTDTLFQNSLASAMQSGQVAMQDTMGQAAALTGGYGSTYATSAANQAYNGYIQDAYANLPDYYNMALDAYNMEGQGLYNQLGMYQTADDTEYSRLANAYEATFGNANSMYDKEYNNYWQTQNYNQNERQTAASMAQRAAEFNTEMAYKKARDQVADDQWYSEMLLKNSSNATTAEGPQYKVASDSSKVKTITEAFEENGYEGGIAMLRKYDAQLTDDDLDWFNQWIAESGYAPKLSFADRISTKGKTNPYRN